jgi:hypothetical protein
VVATLVHARRQHRWHLHVGYEDIAFFRRLFKRHTGSAPRVYRARFGPRAGAGASAKTPLRAAISAA